MYNKYILYIYARGPVFSVIYDNESLGSDCFCNYCYDCVNFIIFSSI